MCRRLKCGIVMVLRGGAPVVRPRRCSHIGESRYQISVDTHRRSSNRETGLQRTYMIYDFFYFVIKKNIYELHTV